MGTWGSGAFDSDDASETRDDVAARLAQYLALVDREEFGFEEMNTVVAAAALLNAIAARTLVRLPPAADCRRWREHVLATWDSDPPDGDPQWKTDYRATLATELGLLAENALSRTTRPDLNQPDEANN